MDVRGLAEAIRNEDALAEQRSAEIQGQDVAIFFGSCGSGKTAVCAYAQEVNFKRVRERLQWKLEPSHQVPRFEIGDQFADVTQGLAVAQLNDIFYVDSAGQQATSGVVTELKGAINRCAVLQKARSIRVVLVLKDAKLDVGVARGGSAIRDFEHVASLFQDIESNVGSVGLILTTHASKLHRGAAAVALAETRDALEGLVNLAVSTDDWQVIGGQTPGHQISAKGLVLVRHFMEQCNRACDFFAEQLAEGEDQLILQYLVEQGLGIFPVNVTEADQRTSLQTWISNLLPVQHPQDQMEYNLPEECSAELERELGRQLLQVKGRIENKNYEWVFDQGLEQDVVNHLDLAGILVARGLLPGAHLPRADLCTQILRQNQVCVEIMEVGICRGHVGNLEQTLRALSSMDEFRRKCGATVDDHLLGWLSKSAALTRCIKSAEGVLDGKLPKSWSLRWDTQSQTEVSSIFTAVQMLEEPRASKLLEGWAERLWDHLHDLNRRATECSSSKVSVQALAELKNAEKFLSQRILPHMAKHHEGLRSFDFQVFVAQTEDRILEKLLELSTKVVELRRLSPSGNMELLHKLQEFCRSTELNELLEEKLEQETLEQRFVTNPVSTAFAPEQTEIDALKAKIQNGSLPEDFGPDLSKLVRRLDCCGDLVPELVGAKKFCFDELVALLKQQVADLKEGAVKALRHLAPRIAGRQVPSSGASTESTTDDELPKVEEEEAETIQAALDQLNIMLPFDTLLCHLGELGCVSANLIFLGYCLVRKLRTSLAAAERESGRKKWGGSGALSSELFGNIHLLQVLQSLAEYMIPLLQPEDLLNELRDLQQKSKDFLKGSVAHELEEWKRASTSGRGWLKTFAEHVRTAKKLSQLLHCIPGVDEAITELQQKIASFQEKVLQEAETSEDQKDWQRLAKSLRDGLAFEESDLFRLLPGILGKSKHFREMAEMQVDACCAAARVAGPDQKLDQWQRLTFFMEHLPKDFETQLDKVRQELGSALSDAESKFHRAISEHDLCAAAHLLAQVQHPDRHCDRFNREVSSALKQLNIIGEVDDVRAAAKKLWALKHADTSAITDPKIASLVDRAREDVQVMLQSLGEEAAVNLQKALEGDGPPNHALSIYAALSGQPTVVAGRLAMTRFATRMKAEFSNWNREKLMQWIEQHNQTWKEMPEELKSSNSDLLSNFMQHLLHRFDSDASELDELLGEEHCEWQKAKGRHEDLRAALASAEKLERLKPFSSQLSKLKRLLPHPNSKDWPGLKKQLKDGQFHQAVAALVLSDGDAEEQLFDAIESALAENKNLAGCDAATVQQRLDALDVFLDAAGKDPPYQLRQFVKEARKLVTKHRPELDEKVAHAVEAILTAASSTERDLKLLAEALELNQEHERLASKEQNQVVQQGLDAFHEAISKAVEKVLHDVTTLAAESLQVNVQPVKNWVKVFASLKDEQKKLVSQRLGFQKGLLKWIEDLLTPACAKAFGADAVLPLLEKLEHSSFENDLPELSERAKIAEKLCHALGSFVGLNFKGLEEQVGKHITQQKCAAQEALKVEDIKTFGDRLKHMNSVADALPQLRLSVHVQDLETTLRRQVLDKHSHAIRNAETATAAVDSCVRLRKVAVEAPDTYAWVTPEIAAALKDLASTRAFQRDGMLMVEQQLQMMADVGQSIVAENPGIFGAVKEALNNEAFRKFGTTGDIGTVVARMTEASKLNGQEYWDLRRALEQHSQLLNTLTKKYLFRDKKFEEVMQEAKSDLLNAVCGCQTTNTCSSVQTLLTHLAACYMLVKSGKAFLESPPAEQARLLDQLPFPHWVQMLTLFRFLQAHQETKRGGVLDPLWRWMFGPPGACSPENHLAEVKTGEGKCLLLDTAAAFFALRGIKVDIACYQRALMDQDRRAMLEFNEFLGVDQMIRHVTLDDLCNERLDPIVDHSKALLTGEVPSTSRVDMSQRVLLIDEVDMLFTKRFYGRTWQGGFTLKSPAAKELVKYIFEARSTSKEIPNITTTTFFQNLLKEYPVEMHSSLALAAKCLVKNSENWNEPKPELNEKKTQVGYTGAMEIDWSLSYRNKTVFVYQQLQEDGKMSPEVAEEKIGVDMLAGVFSFADLPRKYKYILGVTGTLSELRKTPGLEETLKNDYDFRHFTIAPSIFGGSKLNFDPVRLLDNETDWISEIESAIKAHQEKGHSVLVFFKNQKSLQKLPKWKTYERLTKTTDPSKIPAYVAEATNKCKVTLLVKNFGRGLDFQMKESEVAVLQTYLSSTESEMRQIQGRTGRKGRYGHYGLILCADHLQAKMGFNADDLKTLRIPEHVQPLLERKQQEKTLLKLKKSQQHRKTASRIEERTQQWEELLFSSASREVKLSKLAAWNEEHCSLHYILVVDNSGSMSGTPWRQITAAVQGYKEELLQNPSVAASTKVSTVCFNSAAHVVQSHAAVEDMTGLQDETCGGRTSFSAAFSTCHEVMRHTPPESNEFILFFTDGDSNDLDSNNRPNKVPSHEIIALLTHHASRISGLTCIAFGTDAGENTLREIGKIFKTYKPTIDFKLQKASTEESLVQCFAEAATSGAMHCR